MKSQVGSFGNNFNNRTEEAIGTAHDFWTAYRENAFGKQPRPFVGWLMLVEDAPGSRSPVRDASPHFPVFPEFQGASYLKRYDLLCQRLVQEQLYTTAAIDRGLFRYVGYDELQDLGHCVRGPYRDRSRAGLVTLAGSDHHSNARGCAGPEPECDVAIDVRIKW